ncbi:COG1305 Transglutaminase-like enzymes, putative cysteine proteases [Rhabdaerophilaceae bacterium]
MLYDVTLCISYGFGAHAASGRQILRVLPKAIPGSQKLIAAAIDFKPRPQERQDGFDFFGNPVTEARFQQCWEMIAFRMQARVHRLVEPVAFDLSPTMRGLRDDLARCQRLDHASPHHFTASSARIARDSAISAYAMAQHAPTMTVFETVSALNSALFRDMRFDADATDVNTPAAEAFDKRLGVCQDFAHIMISGLRALGIPAGYVSGFLRTYPPDGQARLEGADAMHAWVRAWCGQDLGWIEFDPTNGVIVANDHVVVAIGRDYDDVSPVAGILKTTGRQITEQAVDVVPIDRGQ